MSTTASSVVPDFSAGMLEGSAAGRVNTPALPVPPVQPPAPPPPAATRPKPVAQLVPTANGNGWVLVVGQTLVAAATSPEQVGDMCQLWASGAYAAQ